MLAEVLGSLDECAVGSSVWLGAGFCSIEPKKGKKTHAVFEANLIDPEQSGNFEPKA